MAPKDSSHNKALQYHALFYFLLTGIWIAFGRTLLIDEGSSHWAPILYLLLFVLSSQVLTIIIGRASRFVFFCYLLSDSAVTLLLVRATGGSASPFLVFYPIVTLVGAIALARVQVLALLASTLVLQLFSVGLIAGLIGNALATTLTSVLGLYLVRALEKSGILLRISEGQRKRLENLQKAILANIPSGLMSVDSQGRIIQVNTVGAKILGVGEGEVLLHPLKEFLPEIYASVVKLSTLVPQINQLETAPDRPTVKFKTPAGAQLDLGFSVARLSDPDDRSVIGSLVVFQDLTAVTRMEESLRKSEKLAAVGKLAGSIAHEIRNPLAGISGSAQLLSNSVVASDEDKKLLKIIQRESSRLDVLITDFLEYVKPQKPNSDPVRLPELAQGVVESLRVNPKWTALKAELVIVPPPSGHNTVLGDDHRIIQCLMNLVLNSGQAQARRVEIDLSKDGWVFVRDNGKGITPQHQARLFEPFFTTKESGTGLGLATTYRILEAMGATIRVRSPIGPGGNQGGTEFAIQFRLQRPVAQSA
jgi:two-component system sensor histidine kinase PilS (NtrC family)